MTLSHTTLSEVEMGKEKEEEAHKEFPRKKSSKEANNGETTPNSQK